MIRISSAFSIQLTIALCCIVLLLYIVYFVILCCNIYIDEQKWRNISSITRTLNNIISVDSALASLASPTPQKVLSGMIKGSKTKFSTYCWCIPRSLPQILSPVSGSPMLMLPLGYQWSLLPVYASPEFQ